MTIRRAGLACLLLALLSLWLRSGFPVFAIPGAPDDDGLFVALARHLGAGHWLGPFNARTLVKGMFYPLFILAAFVAGIPLKIAEHLVYLAAAWAVAWAVLTAGARPVLAVVAFAALALNPVLWTNPLARVIREGLYIGQSLGLVGLLVLAGWARSVRMRLVWGGFAGLAGAAFWLTREEGVWLLPSLLVLAAGVALDGVVRPEPAATRVVLTPRWPAVLGRVLVPAAAAAAVWLAGTAGVAEINRRHYGVFVTNEVKSYPYRHAYGALARITPDHWARYVVFPADARARAYAVSPAARELQPYLDGQPGAFWQQVGCRQTNTSDCPEILAGWFQWALRGAAADAGHYGSEKQAAAYYERLGREIDAACDRGALPCGPRRASLAPPFHLSYLADAARVVPRLAQMVVCGEPGAVGSLPSLNGPEQQLAFADMVGPIVPPQPSGLLAASAARQAMIQRIAQPFAWAFAAVMPWATGAALLGVALSLRRWRRRRPSILLLTLAAASAVAVAVRIALLSYLEVTAIPSANVLYASPATPFAILFAVLGCWLGAEALLRTPS